MLLGRRSLTTAKLVLALEATRVEKYVVVAGVKAQFFEAHLEDEEEEEEEGRGGRVRDRFMLFTCL